MGDAATNATACYRLKPYFRNVGVACTALFAVIGLASVFLAYFNVDDSFPRPLFAATCFGLFWACFVLLGVFLLLLHRRYRLWVNADSVRQRGVLLDRTVDLSTVTELKWRRFPTGGSVRLSGSDGTLKIELGNFVQGQRDDVIAFLRDATPEDRQYGWDEFRRQFEDCPKRRIRTRRASWALSLLLAFQAVAFLVLWGLRFGNPFLVIALVNIAFLIYLRRGTWDGQPDSEDGEPSDATERRSRAFGSG